MTRTEATQFLPAPAWEDPRVHLIDDSWLLTIFAALLAILAPWLLNGFEIDIVPTSMGLLALGLLHIAFTAIASPTRSAARWRPRTLIALQSLGVLLLAFIWQHAGGIQNPGFLLVFALPVMGAVFLSRWQPYLMALIAIVACGAIALAQAPGLRWYAPGLDFLGAALAKLNGDNPGAFAGFYAPSGFYMAMLESFAIGLIASAVAAEYLGAVFERLHAQVFAARTEAERGQELWAALVEDMPLPSVLVDAETLRIICASAAAERQLLGDAPGAGRPLLEALHFCWPEVVQELIAGPGGTAPLCAARIQGELRTLEVRAQQLAQKGRRFTLLLIIDRTTDAAVKAALDAADYAAVVLDPQGRVLVFNKPAMGLFSRLEPGLPASQVLPPSQAAAPWWEAGFSGRRKIHIEILQRIYQVTSSSLALPAEEGQLTILAFRPVARATDTGQTGTYPVASSSPPSSVSTQSRRVLPS